jgi:type IV secretion system protein VirB9
MNSNPGGIVMLAGILSLAGLLAVSRAAAEVMPERGAVDSRVRVAAYDAEQVYRLHGFVGYQIDLEFEAGESFVGLGAGDIEGLSYAAQDNHLFLKPKAAKVATNLTVLTNRRHYQFDYAALAQRPAPSDPDVIYALRFIYAPPPGRAAEEASARHIEAALANATLQRPQNLDYWYCGGPALRPVAVSDDGVQTRLKFAASAELPAIFVRNDDDSESLLNYSMADGDVIVQRIARRFVLRRGRLVGCIVNKGFVGGGNRLDSGTVSPGVERTVQGVVP